MADVAGVADVGDALVEGIQGCWFCDAGFSEEGE